MSKSLEISPGTHEIADGWKAVIKPINSFDQVTPSSTAYHEAIHTVAALLTGSHVKEASRRSGPGFLGRTILSEFNAIAFIAPHAKGCSGTGYDVSVLAIMGHDPDSLASAARSVLIGHEGEVHAVASLIEINGSISGYEAKEIMGRVNDPEAEIKITNPLGEERHFVIKVRG